MYEVPNWTITNQQSKPDNVDPNHGLHCQIVMRSAGYYAAQRSNSIPTFCYNLLAQVQGSRNPKERIQYD